MKLENMKIEIWNIVDVKPYENNPRNNEDAVEDTSNSIRDFGWKQPIVVDKDGVIIVGHTRLKAAEKLKLKQVPVIVARDLTPEQVKAYRIADNKTGEISYWNNDLLQDEISNLDDFDMTNYGFTQQELDNLFEDPLADAGDLDDYEEPEKPQLICPHCGFKADSTEFKE